MKSKRRRIKEGWEGASKEGKVLGEQIVVNGIMWAPILWDGEEDPDWQKSVSLEELLPFNKEDVNG